MQKILIIGASGATGKHLVEQILETGHKVKIIIRPTIIIPDYWANNENLTIIKRNLSEIGVNEMSEYISDCRTVASCLGHNLTIKGIFGKPRKLVTDSVKLLCKAIFRNSSDNPIKFVLMNTTGNSNRDINEPISVAHKIVNVLLRTFIPPHSDNEQAADYLRVKVGQNNDCIEWVVVRPDTLINVDIVTEYSIHKSPTRSPLFNPGKTSRINVANFMAKLIADADLWDEWKGQMPVIYNTAAA